MQETVYKAEKDEVASKGWMEERGAAPFANGHNFSSSPTFVLRITLAVVS